MRWTGHDVERSPQLYKEHQGEALFRRRGWSNALTSSAPRKMRLTLPFEQYPPLAMMGRCKGWMLAEG